MGFKLNGADAVEFLGTYRFRQFPSIWEKKAEELVKGKIFETYEEAKKECANWEFSLELYYEIDGGVFAVECDAVECGTIYSPYTAELGEEYKEDF